MFEAQHAAGGLDSGGGSHAGAGQRLDRADWDAFGKAVGVNLQFGAMVAFIVAMTPFALVGITSALWSVVAGLVASLFAERPELKAAWSAGLD